MMFAHVAPRKGLAHEHDFKSVFKDVAKLGFHEATPKCDGEPALRSV